MHITLLTNEYPPHVYGGAGVHVEYLSRSLAALWPGTHRIEVLSFGSQRVSEGDLQVTGVEPDFTLPSQNDRHAKLMDTLARDLLMAGRVCDAEVVHCHTWYTHFAGCLLQKLLDIPLVLTTHSLEPHRPWKAEQLGRAYEVSTWLEHNAYRAADGVVAVSQAMRRDVRDLYGVPDDRIRVIPNGIDTDEFQPRRHAETLRSYGVDPDRPLVLFVGRITRQKGVLHLLRAVPHLPAGVQIVLCAGMPDTRDIGAEMEERVRALQAQGKHSVHWIRKMLPRADLIAFYSQATLFVCPSVYEPFGIINLEAMACGVPVVASKVGGIPEVVVDGATGILVDVDPVGGENFEPRDPEAFARRLAAAATELLQNPDRARAFGGAARQRVEARFSWEHVAAETLSFYQELRARHAD